MMQTIKPPFFFLLSKDTLRDNRQANIFVTSWPYWRQNHELQPQEQDTRSVGRAKTLGAIEQILEAQRDSSRCSCACNPALGKLRQEDCQQSQDQPNTELGPVSKNQDQ